MSQVPLLCEILVVDDEHAIRHLVEKILTRQGYTVVTARHGEEALEIYRRDPDKIQLVLTDIIMPVVDGWGAIRALREINPNVKIIASSGLMSDASEAGCSDLKVSAFLSKPYNAKTLVETVRDVLRS